MMTQENKKVLIWTVGATALLVVAVVVAYVAGVFQAPAPVS